MEHALTNHAMKALKREIRNPLVTSGAGPRAVGMERGWWSK